ncbi:MAG: SpoIIE family protein phosphatase [Salinivirgaceae bacterium]
MRHLLLVFISSLFCVTVQSQINQYGIPFITNYTPQEYGSNDQNWCIVQDARGVVYVGNNTCILEYDGVTWRKISASNNSIIRSMATDSAGGIFVGAVGDFGELKPDNRGDYQYQSLLSKIDTSELDFADIWKTYLYSDKVYFCAYNKIFTYSRDTVQVMNLNNDNKFTFLIDSTLYSEHFNIGLKKMVGDSLKLINKGEYFADKDVFFMAGYNPQKILIGTIFNGLTVYNTTTQTHETSIFNQSLNKELSKSYLYGGAKIKNDLFGLGTIQNGAIFIDKQGKISNHITPREGLQDIIVTSIYSNNNQSDLVWLSLSKGLGKIEINSPLRKFGKEQGIEGSVNDIIRFNGELFVSTDLGVYYLKFDSDNYPQFIKIEGISDQSWSFLNFKENTEHKLLVATVVGLFEIKNHKAEKIIFNHGVENYYYCYKLFQDTLKTNLLYIGHSKGLLSVKIEHNLWERVDAFPEIKDEIRQIDKTSDSDLWLGTYFKGVIRIQDNNNSKYAVYRYGKESGLESLNDIFVFTAKNQVFFGTASGLFSYKPLTNKIERDSLFGIDYQIGKKSILKVAHNANNEDFYVSALNKNHNHLEHIVVRNHNQLTKDSLSFMRLPSEQVEAIYCDENNITWFGSSSGLYSFNTATTKDYSNSYNTLIRKVTLNEDSTVFLGTFFSKSSTGELFSSLLQPPQMVFQFDYELNDITFEFAAPFFEEEKEIEFSYLLEGYKDTWTKWKKEPKAVFTNLREGKYNFKVKAKNIYAIESSTAEYRFTISPPWYRTILAYIVYGILIIIGIYFIVKLYTRKLEQEKITLEGIVQDRTAEIRCQKDAIELKNEVLKEQKEEITKQKDQITSSIVYAKRIQRAIVPSEEVAFDLLKNYFLLWRPRDIVSGDFWWLGEKDGLVIVAAADCTGHGVPGAFMSMLGISFLNEIINQQKQTQSHEILNRLRTKVKTTLGQTGKDGEAKDGMDIALLVIDFNKLNLQFSGAYNPLYLVRNGELEIIKADKNPIGIYIKEKETFTQNLVPLQKGDTLYIFSDGYIDQFGGQHEMKYTSNRFRDFLLTIQDKTMAEQKELLNSNIDEWRGPIEQIDDIIVLGIRI